MVGASLAVNVTDQRRSVIVKLKDVSPKTAQQIKCMYAVDIENVDIIASL